MQFIDNAHIQLVATKTSYSHREHYAAMWEAVVEKDATPCCLMLLIFSTAFPCCCKSMVSEYSTTKHSTHSLFCNCWQAIPTMRARLSDARCMQGYWLKSKTRPGSDWYSVPLPAGQRRKGVVRRIRSGYAIEIHPTSVQYYLFASAIISQNPAHVSCHQQLAERPEISVGYESRG